MSINELKEKLDEKWKEPGFRKATYIIVPTLSFITGLVIPSPFTLSHTPKLEDITNEVLKDTTNMVLPDGSVYEGSILSVSKLRQGYGKLTTPEGSVYEGEWLKDHLDYGTKTTQSSVYVGHFDADLKLSGFGIIDYSEGYIKSKRAQGTPDADITKRYIGNWSNNRKQGLGRSIKCDESMEFGNYRKGIFQKVEGANYRVGESVYGIDVSHYQKDLDWDNLALYCDAFGNVTASANAQSPYLQPVLFCYIKATEGASVQDDKYNSYVAEAKHHGIVHGAYHFLRLETDINKQVQNFLETVKWSEGDLPPVLDVEEEQEILKIGAGPAQTAILDWLEKVEQKLGVRPIIYTRDIIRSKYLTDPRFSTYEFWIALYSDNQPSSLGWLIWQKTDKGFMNGSKGQIDVNFFKGNYSAFCQFLTDTAPKK